MDTWFVLKPKGGPRLHFTIGEFDPLTTYSDICQMPLATMTTTHHLSPGDQTTIQVRIEIRGILAPLWGWLVGRHHARGLPAQTERFIAAAQALSGVDAVEQSFKTASPCWGSLSQGLLSLPY